MLPPVNGPEERYQLLRKIGQGTFGSVWKGLDATEGRDVAVKVIDLEDVDDDIADIQQEISTLRGCRHPNITQYYGSFMSPGSSRLLIVMELMAVSVADLLQPPPRAAPSQEGLSERAIAHVLHCVLRALAYLHSQRRLHRDIKAANILLSGAGAVKVSDFGVSTQLSGTIGYKRRTFVGSPLWMAPEVIEQAPDAMAMPGSDPSQRAPDGYGMPADIWSLGVTAIEMAKGAPPRSDVSSFRLLFMIVREDPPALEGSFSTEFKDFVWQCLRKDPADRPSPSELLDHPFVADAREGAAELAQLVAEHAAREAIRAVGGADGARRGPLTPGTIEAHPDADEPSDGGDVVPSPRTDTSDDAGGRPSNSWEFESGTLAAAGGGALAVGGTVSAPAVSGSLAVGETIPAAAVSGTGDAPRRASRDGGALKGADSAASAGIAAAGAVAATSGGAPVSKETGPASERASPAAAPLASVASPTTSRFVPPERAVSATFVAQTRVSPRRHPPADRVDVVGSLLRPALAEAAADEPTRSAAAAAVAALSRMEAAAPGSTGAALGNVLVALSTTSDPQLTGLKGAAHVVFGPGPGAGATPADAPAGPLGGFLLARWREGLARERLQRHQQQYAQN